MARELTHAIKLYLILGSFEKLTTIILLGVDSVTPYCRHILVNLGSIPGSGHILSFLLKLSQEGQSSVTGESMCTKYWLTA